MKAIKKENPTSAQSVFAFYCVCPWPGSCSGCPGCLCQSAEASARAYTGAYTAVNINTVGGTASTF